MVPPNFKTQPSTLDDDDGDNDDGDDDDDDDDENNKSIEHEDRITLEELRAELGRTTTRSGRSVTKVSYS